jgi:hypothetical protein
MDEAVIDRLGETALKCLKRLKDEPLSRRAAS